VVGTKGSVSVLRCGNERWYQKSSESLWEGLPTQFQPRSVVPFLVALSHRPFSFSEPRATGELEMMESVFAATNAQQEHDWLKTSRLLSIHNCNYGFCRDMHNRTSFFVSAASSLSLRIAASCPDTTPRQVHEPSG